MKIRMNYVSNSSSSSYVIAYDKNFFGDLKELIKNTDYIGCETYIKDSSDMSEFFEYHFDNDSDKIAEFKNKMEDQKKKGKDILYFGLDHEYHVIIELLEQFNKLNGGDKFEILYGED